MDIARLKGIRQAKSMGISTSCCAVGNGWRNGFAFEPTCNFLEHNMLVLLSAVF